MRVKNTTQVVSWKATNSSRNCSEGNSCVWSDIPSQGTISAPTSFTRSDIQRNQSVNGWRPPSAYSAELSETGVVTGTYQWTGLIGSGKNANGGARLTRDGAMFRVAVNLDYSPPSERDSARLKGKALSRLKNQQLSVGMALATRRQTMDLLASNAARLATAYSQARQRNFAAAAKTLGIRNHVRPGTKSASSGWLQLQFGWMPLASDIYGAYQELTMKKPKSGDLAVLRVSDHETGSFTELSQYYPVGVSYGGAEVETKVTYQRTVKQSYWFKLDLESLHAASRNGLTDPLSVAWDLVPFSFMVNWLLPVGQYLNNCTASAGFDYLGGSQTYFERRTRVAKSGKILQPQGNPYKSNSVTLRCAGKASGFRMSRIVLPRPTAELYLKNPLSTFTVITSLALLTQRFQSSVPWRQIARTTVRGG